MKSSSIYGQARGEAREGFVQQKLKNGIILIKGFQGFGELL